VQTVEYSVNSVAAAAGANYCDLAAASTDDIYLRELHFFTAAATASSVALFRTTAVGTRTSPVTPTAAANGQLGTVGEAPTGSVATAWSVVPTLAANRMRSYITAAAAGAGVIWTWYDGLGLRIPASGSITLNNFGASAGSILAVTYVWRE
jgi:hypothetical protein